MSFTLALKQDDEHRTARRKIAETTFAAIAQGSFDLNGNSYLLRLKVENSKKRTLYFDPDSLLSTWSSNPHPSTHPTASSTKTEIAILEISTLCGARFLATNSSDPSRIGVLNFASAKKPGGGVLSGAQAQEESIARSSTFYPTLLTSTAQKFYTLHNRDAKDGYYSHAMIYSPEVVVFRDDDGGWVEPLAIDVLTSPAVNAGVVRKSLRGRLAVQAEEDRIERVMKERMARILFLFEKKGVKDVVLGSFGTGVFRNDVKVVAKLWADLLSVPKARFKHSFNHVVFAILGRKTFVDFDGTFNARMEEATDSEPTSRTQDA